MYKSRIDWKSSDMSQSATDFGSAKICGLYVYSCYALSNLILFSQYKHD